MTKERLIYIGALLAVFAGVFAVYHFYFAAKLERYAQHQALLESLQATEAKLKTTFGNASPEDVIRDHNGKVEAWREAISQRTTFFTDQDWRIHEKPPEDVFILQFWYGDESRKMVTDLWEKAQKKYGPLVYQNMPQGFPSTVQSMLGVSYSEQWQGMDVDAALVNTELEKLEFGISAIEMLMNNNALGIYQVGIEELGDAGFIGKGVKYTRVKLSFRMEIKDLVEFLENLRQADSFYSVEGMRLTHPYILAQYEPQLQVDMYLLRTKQEEGFDPAGSAGGGSAGAGYENNFSSTGLTLGGNRANTIDDDVVMEEPGTIGKAWKWFKRTVLYMN